MVMLFIALLGIFLILSKIPYSSYIINCHWASQKFIIIIFFLSIYISKRFDDNGDVEGISKYFNKRNRVTVEPAKIIVLFEDKSGFPLTETSPCMPVMLHGFILIFQHDFFVKYSSTNIETSITKLLVELHPRCKLPIVGSFPPNNVHLNVPPWHYHANLNFGEII